MGDDLNYLERMEIATYIRAKFDILYSRRTSDSPRKANPEVFLETLKEFKEAEEKIVESLKKDHSLTYPQAQKMFNTYFRELKKSYNEKVEEADGEYPKNITTIVNETLEDWDHFALF